MIKSTIFTLLVLFTSLTGISQSQKIDWKDVKVYEFTTAFTYPDSLEICGGEWFVKGKANNLNELNSAELKRIKKRVAKCGCKIVYVDTRNIYKPRKLYILGLKRKK